MPTSTRTPRSADRQQDTSATLPKRLILCFDGTGNAFQGTPGDTNIVKLYNMFDRANLSQMHYYQPGIGTYPAEGPVNVSIFRTLMRKLEAVVDQALATSFDSHVIAGYRFLMRYYKPGDRIYVFGFSRGAFTARFLTRMISHVGLLSMGNEELIPFAYKVYQDYERNNSGTADKQKAKVIFMNSFKSHFCRNERDEAKESGEKISDNESGIKVHFLGLFDCVNSVGNLDVPFFQKKPPLPAVQGTAKHIRHAVAIDERRVKFKAALFSQEPVNETEDIKEVWFPGNHGNVGGGWDIPAREDGEARDTTQHDYFQLSDIALKWMIDEIDDVEEEEIRADQSKSPAVRLAWNIEQKYDFVHRFQLQERQDEMISARMHDTMKFGGGCSFFKVMLWNFLEHLPYVIKRWEFVQSPHEVAEWVWDYIGWPPNRGGRRHIPSTALFHHSVINRMRLPSSEKKEDYRPNLYTPNNPLWVKSANTSHTEQLYTTTGARGKEVAKKNLEELAEQYNPKDVKHNLASGAQRPAHEPQIRFKHEESQTTGTTPIVGKKVVVGAQEWDQIYSVILEPSGDDTRYGL